MTAEAREQFSPARRHMEPPNTLFSDDETASRQQWRNAGDPRWVRPEQRPRNRADMERDIHPLLADISVPVLVVQTEPNGGTENCSRPPSTSTVRRAGGRGHAVDARRHRPGARRDRVPHRCTRRGWRRGADDRHVHRHRRVDRRSTTSVRVDGASSSMTTAAVVRRALLRHRGRRSRRSVTASWRCSTALAGRCGAQRTSPSRWPTSVCRSVPACSRRRSRCRVPTSLGSPVVMTRRICDLGGARDVLVSETVRSLLGDSEFRFTERGEHTLKGLRAGRRSSNACGRSSVARAG